MNGGTVGRWSNADSLALTLFTHDVTGIVFQYLDDDSAMCLCLSTKAVLQTHGLPWVQQRQRELDDELFHLEERIARLTTEVHCLHVALLHWHLFLQESSIPWTESYAIQACLYTEARDAVCHAQSYLHPAHEKQWATLKHQVRTCMLLRSVLRICVE